MEPHVKGRLASKPFFLRDHAPVLVGVASAFVAFALLSETQSVARQPVVAPVVARAEAWTDAWPFRENEVTLSCRELGAQKLPAVFVTVDGETYGLNGLASSIATSPRPVLRDGADVNAMIAQGAALCAGGGVMVVKRG